jgi:hypothetical protein
MTPWDLSHWRKRLGDKLELLLAESLPVATLARRTQKPFSALWYVTRSMRPASTSGVDGSGCGFMSVVVSPVSPLRTPIPRHIEVARPDVDPALPGRRLVRNVVYRMLIPIEVAHQNEMTPPTVTE